MESSQKAIVLGICFFDLSPVIKLPLGSCDSAVRGRPFLSGSSLAHMVKTWFDISQSMTSRKDAMQKRVMRPLRSVRPEGLVDFGIENILRPIECAIAQATGLNARKYAKVPTAAVMRVADNARCEDKDTTS